MKNAKIYINITVCLSNCDEISATPSAFCISETRLQWCNNSQKPDYNGEKWAIFLFNFVPSTLGEKSDRPIQANEPSSGPTSDYTSDFWPEILWIPYPFRQMSLHLGRLPTTRLISGRKSYESGNLIKCPQIDVILSHFNLIFWWKGTMLLDFFH